MLYAGESQKLPIVSHRPFIADSIDKIKELYTLYRR
ncbi:hypothetical protein GXP67_05845 [Rhodocytophaga rosea]|uniref:Uncharacterized protein n=1 Tax=Rhodocytophaga rosea TaxID=2704465 RepID=A0A6C0GDY6_9BACT|nr:hypothetical protein GXP67_05845 [Rhodocytophaga rosea]